MGKLFTKSDFDPYSEDIENLLNPFDGWHIGTSTDWENIIGSERNGSTVNGTTNKHYALLQLTGVSFCGTNNPLGIIIFPDNEVIIGKTLSGMDNTTKTTGVSERELNEYLSQGCVFLPACGYVSGTEDEPFEGFSNYGRYLLSNLYDAGDYYLYFLRFSTGGVEVRESQNYDDIGESKYMIRLVK